MPYTSPDVYEFIAKKTADPILERRTCTVSGTQFPIYQSDHDFYAKISPTFAGQRFQIPYPTLCPEERQRKRLLWRNERKLYKRKCDLTGQPIVTMYHPSFAAPVYQQDARWNDSWSPHDYGQDASHTIFDNLNHLLKNVPYAALYTSKNASDHGCKYVNYAGHNKDSYLIFDSDFNESSLYSEVLKESESCIDCSYVYHCRECFDLIYCVSCYGCRQCLYTSDSSYCIGCRSCINCQYCLNCFSLQNKQYCINNKQYDKMTYFQLLGNADESINYSVPQFHRTSDDCENTWGSGLTHAKNGLFVHDSGHFEDVRYATGIFKANDIGDTDSFGHNMSLVYNSLSCGHDVHRLLCCVSTNFGSHDLLYCLYCPGTSHSFGCVGLRNASYCIFNRQYSKHEYEQTVAKIIHHMQETGERGEFFHPSLSPFGYNETVAQEYFPLTRDEALARGYKRQDQEYPINIPEGIVTVNGQDLPDTIDGVDDSILNQAVICEVSGKPFRIVKPELAFYRKHQLPLPRQHPDIRHQHRLAKRPGRTLHLRNCDKTGEQILSVYPQGTPFQVYSEEAYRQAVYG